MKLCVVTCTGKRPKMLPLCARWVRNQVRPPDRWVISLGEGEELGDVQLPEYAIVHRWKSEAIGKPMHGQIDSNSKYQIEAIRQVPKDHAAIYFDDDDWYGPEYLSVVERDLLDGFSFSGNGSERRYSLRLNAWMHVEKSGCNAGAVAIGQEGISAWIEWLQDPSTKWSWLADRFRVNLRNGAPRVSIKHGPGLGHLFPPAERKWTVDPTPLSMLRAWIGRDADAYRDLVACASG